ncbi:unnamed protein product [Trichogramma brassicae]|uniref:Uncharacterized protein n=1 Tax=Trichogramma brassicae TaxID=86971 RepID=A0A6H5IWH4_9HYME|nr:unnamed protein product [Trichogramma brassicae]
METFWSSCNQRTLKSSVEKKVLVQNNGSGANGKFRLATERTTVKKKPLPMYWQFLSRAEERNKGRKISKGVQVNTRLPACLRSRAFSQPKRRAITRTILCSDQFLAPRRKTFGVTVFLARECSKITKSAVSRSGRIRTRIRPIQTHHGRTPPAADGQGGGRGDGQHIPRADGAEPRQDNPLEQLIGNPLFQAMARAPAVNAVGNCRLPAFWRSDPDLWFFSK